MQSRSPLGTASLLLQEEMKMCLHVTFSNAKIGELSMSGVPAFKIVSNPWGVFAIKSMSKAICGEAVEEFEF